MYTDESLSEIALRMRLCRSEPLLARVPRQFGRTPRDYGRTQYGPLKDASITKLAASRAYQLC
jgi:AraC-like DNA-binding protein